MEEKDVFFVHSSGKTMYRKWRGESVNTNYGEIHRKDVGKHLVKTSKGEEFITMEPLLRDRIQNMRKGARPIYEYDAGVIVAMLSLQKDFTVLEAGAGSAHLTAFMANIVKQVDCFEKEERFYEIAKENVEHLDNVNLKYGDLLEQKLTKEYDAIFLDLYDPVEGIEKTYENLKPGHFMGVFTPVIDFVKPTMEKMVSLNFVDVQGILFDNKEIELKKYARIKGPLGFPGFFVVGRKFK